MIMEGTQTVNSRVSSMQRRIRSQVWITSYEPDDRAEIGFANTPLPLPCQTRIGKADVLNSVSVIQKGNEVMNTPYAV